MLFDEEFIRSLEYLSIVARKILSGQERADRESLRRGGSIEFADHRTYTPGDELKYLDWNVYARHGHLFIKEFSAEENVHVRVFLDASRSMAGATGAKGDFAKRLAAALAYVGLAHFDQISFFPFAATLGDGVRALRGKQRIFELLPFIEKIPYAGTTSLEAAFRTPVPKQRGRRVGLVISDLYDLEGYARGLRLLLAQGLELRVLHLVEEGDLDPGRTGRLKLVDRETRRTREVLLTEPLAARYRLVLEAWLEEVESWCLASEIGYARVLTSLPLEKVVVELLRRKGVLDRR
ncbi:MAG: DUF58 domain-containing protein [Planctomycetes bacterium]|nr:DUF58 domain-containing protein [Planctomycetota bacterium]